MQWNRLPARNSVTTSPTGIENVREKWRACRASECPMEPHFLCMSMISKENGMSMISYDVHYLWYKPLFPQYSLLTLRNWFKQLWWFFFYSPCQTHIFLFWLDFFLTAVAVPWACKESPLLSSLIFHPTVLWWWLPWRGQALLLALLFVVPGVNPSDVCREALWV